MRVACSCGAIRYSRRIIKRYGACGIKTGRETDIFCGLVEAIVSQQLSTQAAATIYGRFRALLPERRAHSRRRCMPLSDEALRGVGLSRQKLGYMRDLSRRHLGRLDKHVPGFWT